MNIRNVAAYFKERFPPVNMLLFAILFLTVRSVAAYFLNVSPTITPKLLHGMIAVISFFFRLRVFDEIKDFKLDMMNHPHRVLQSGKVSVAQLITISAVLTISEIIWSYWNGAITMICWLVAVGYSFLMRYEFFISTFLKKRLFLYAGTHMLIMPLIILWIWSAYLKEHLHHPGFYLLAALSLLGGFSFEMARKIHAPAEERSTVDSYSKSIGLKASIICVLLFLLAGVLVQCYLLYTIDARLWSFILIGILYLTTVFLFLTARKEPKEARFRLAELFVSLFILVSYVSIIIEIHLRK